MKALYQIQSLYISLSLLGLSVACSSEPAQKKGSQTKSAPETQTEMATGDSAPAAAAAAAAAPAAATPKPSFRYYQLVTIGVPSNSVSISNLQFYWDGKWQVNAMTSNILGTIGGLKATLSAFSNYSTAATYVTSNAFDASLTSFWASSTDYSDATGKNWIRVDLGADSKALVTAYKITGGNVLAQSPTAFFLQGSQDAKTWTAVGPTMSGQSTFNKAVCVFFPPQTVCP